MATKLLPKQLTIKRVISLNDYDYLQENLDTINARIARACQRVGRKPADITLVAVTKTIDTDIVNRSIELGINHIGENKPQEIVRKYALIDQVVDWHMIGHLQSNKVKAIIDKVKLIHSVDRLSVVNEIEKRASQNNRIVDILIQVNIGDETQKSGVEVAGVKALLEHIETCQHIRVLGLMCIAPYFYDAEQVRPYFKQMKKIFEEVKTIPLQRSKIEILSMGMTHDFEVAIEEGATMIRVGTGLYGARNY